jgi:hypothetical protein
VFLCEDIPFQGFVLGGGWLVWEMSGNRVDQRIQEAKKLGFSTILSKYNKIVKNGY